MSTVDETRAGDPALDDFLRRYGRSKPRRFGLFGGQYEDYMNRLGDDVRPATGGGGAPGRGASIYIPSASDLSGQPLLFLDPRDGAARPSGPVGAGAAPAAPSPGTPRPPLATTAGSAPQARTTLTALAPATIEAGWDRLTGNAPAGGPSGTAPTQGRAPPAAAGSLTADRLRRIMPLAGAKADSYAGALDKAMRDRGLASPYEQAAFLAQVGHESAQLNKTREDLNYRPDTLHRTWSKRFPTLDAARPYAHNPQALGNRVYAGRNGNGDAASGDGYRYRGGGLLQVTGRRNYRLVGHENDPEALAEPAAAADSAAAYWRSMRLGNLPDRRLSREEFDRLSRKVNGGMNGATERWMLYNRALDVLAPD